MEISKILNNYGYSCDRLGLFKKQVDLFILQTT